MMRSVAACAVALSVAAGSVAVRAADCYSPAERSAVEVRMLQSELMVAALACRDSNPELGMIAGYNDFVKRLSDRLVHNSKLLQAHFKKEYGASGEHRFEAFETELANAASKRSMASSSYCQSSAVLFREIAVLQARDLEQYSAQHATGLGLPVETCTAEIGLRVAR
jgi:hypothetical protein